MDSATIETNARDLLRRFKHLPPRIQTGVLNGLKRGLLLAETRVRTASGVKARRGAAGLMGRVTSFARPSGAGVDAAIGFRKTRGFPYELSQEFGAKAKPGKAMAIPITPQARRYASPRDFPGKLVIPRGRHVLALWRPRLKALEPQYILVKSIPPRLRFRENVMASLDAIWRAVLAGTAGGLKEGAKA